MLATIDELIRRRFTAELDTPENAGKTVYDLFCWTTRDEHLTDYKTGNDFTDDLRHFDFSRDNPEQLCRDDNDTKTFKNCIGFHSFIFPFSFPTVLYAFSSQKETRVFDKHEFLNDWFL